MNKQVEAARQRLAIIEQEADLLRQFLISWEAVEGLLAGPAEPGSTSKESEGESVDESGITASQGENDRALIPPPAVKRTRVTDNPKPAVLIPAAVEIIRECGRPMSRRELHTALSERGLVVRGSDPIKALGTILWRAPDDLVQLGGFGYWPKNDQYRPANYAGTLFPELPEGSTKGT